MIDPAVRNGYSTMTANTIVVDPDDEEAIRNIENLLIVYQNMINEPNARDVTALFVRDDYIQHNPLIKDGCTELGEYFAAAKAAHPSARVVVDKIIAVRNYAFAHVQFFNLLTDDPSDTGIAGVDIYRMDEDGRAAEHWDTLQSVGDPMNSAPWLAPDVPRVNSNSMF